MKAKRITKLCVSSTVLAVGVVAATGSVVSCGDVPMDCTTGRGDFDIQYIGDDKCGLGNGDVIGAQTYMGQGSEKVDGVPLPDLKLASAAIQVARLGTARDNAVGAGGTVTGTPYGYGAWTQPRPDANNFCTVASMPAAVKNDLVPAIPDDPATPEDDSVPAFPAQDLSYNWTNVRFYNTPGIQGLQFDADLTYTDALYVNADASVGCTTTVKAVAVYPAPDCIMLTNVTGVTAVTVPPQEPADYLTGSEPDPEFCGNIKKSGISSDFPVSCVAATAPEYLGQKYTCGDQDPPVCVAVADDAATPADESKVATRGFCVLTSANIPVVK